MHFPNLFYFKLFAFIVYVKVYELKAAPLYLHFISQKTRNQNKTAARKGVKERGRLGVATHSKIGGPLSRALSMSLSSFRSERLIIKRALCGPFVRVVTALLLTLLDQFHVFFFFYIVRAIVAFSLTHTHAAICRLLEPLLLHFPRLFLTLCMFIWQMDNVCSCFLYVCVIAFSLFLAL